MKIKIEFANFGNSVRLQHNKEEKWVSVYEKMNKKASGFDLEYDTDLQLLFVKYTKGEKPFPVKAIGITNIKDMTLAEEVNESAAIGNNDGATVTKSTKAKVS